MKRLTVILTGVACMFAGTPHIQAQAAKPAPAKPTTAQTSPAKPATAPGTKLPAAIETAFKTRYPKATVTKREKLTTGSIVQYEMQLTGANVKEVVLTADGKFVSPK